MKDKKGFTLMEVLLAVMLVGLIGVALAALTRTASRESAIGQSRLLLRNNLSLFLSTLKRDLSETSHVACVGSDECNGNILLEVWQNMGADQKSFGSSVRRKVIYCFSEGRDGTYVAGSFAQRGGSISRHETTSTASSGSFSDPSCSSSSSGNPVLRDVKSINYDGFVSPRIAVVGPGLLQVDVIVELAGTPVINDAVRETLAVPGGVL